KRTRFHSGRAARERNHAEHARNSKPLRFRQPDVSDAVHHDFGTQRISKSPRPQSALAYYSSAKSPNYRRSYLWPNPGWNGDTDRADRSWSCITRCQVRQRIKKPAHVCLTSARRFHDRSAHFGRRYRDFRGPERGAKRGHRGGADRRGNDTKALYRGTRAALSKIGKPGISESSSGSRIASTGSDGFSGSA